jgi:hypothetical protein
MNEFWFVQFFKNNLWNSMWNTQFFLLKKKKEQERTFKIKWKQKKRAMMMDRTHKLEIDILDWTLKCING